MKKTIITIILGVLITTLVIFSAIGVMYLFRGNNKDEKENTNQVVEDNSNSSSLDFDDIDTDTSSATDKNIDTNTDNNTVNNTDKNIDTTNNKKVTMYIFHGETCPACMATLKYLKTILDDYPYLEVKLFEVWNNKENQDFISVVEEKLDVEIKGVPFIIIGSDYHQAGFQEDALKSEIEKAYNDKNYKDIMKPIIDDNKDMNLEEKQLESD